MPFVSSRNGMINYSISRTSGTVRSIPESKDLSNMIQCHGDLPIHSSFSMLLSCRHVPPLSSFEDTRNTQLVVFWLLWSFKHLDTVSYSISISSFETCQSWVVFSWFLEILQLRRAEHLPVYRTLTKKTRRCTFNWLDVYFSFSYSLALSLPVNGE